MVSNIYNKRWVFLGFSVFPKPPLLFKHFFLEVLDLRSTKINTWIKTLSQGVYKIVIFTHIYIFREIKIHLSIYTIYQHLYPLLICRIYTKQIITYQKIFMWIFRSTVFKREDKSWTIWMKIFGSDAHIWFIMFVLYSILHKNLCMYLITKERINPLGMFFLFHSFYVFNFLHLS